MLARMVRNGFPSPFANFAHYVHEGFTCSSCFPTILLNQLNMLRHGIYSGFEGKLGPNRGCDVSLYCQFFLDILTSATFFLQLLP